VSARRWRIGALFVGLFVIGGIIGWLIRDPASHGDQAAESTHARHQSSLDRRIEKAESEVDSAQRGGDEKGGAASLDTEPRSTRAAAAAPAPASAAEQPLAGVTVVVDPGHNGGNATHPEEINRQVVSAADGTTKPCNTTGTETSDGKLTEAEFNFEVAVVVRADLRRLGARVVMTRENNSGVGPCVDERAEIANKAGASVAISIHADGNETEGAHGFDVIHASPEQMIEPGLAEPSLFLARDLRDALVGSGFPTATYVGHNGLDERSDLGGLNLARVPAVLVELGNMRSAEEAEEMESPEYRALLAQALVAGTQRFLEEAQG
jgi:N-acetylmuramoyl-L-alanine amidase